MLRDFLYLDRSTVREFLAQIEGGEFDQTTERVSQSGGSGFGVRAGITAVGAEASKSKGTGHEAETVVRQVAASEFNRLYESLDREGLVMIDEVDKVEWLDEVRRRQFIEVDARIVGAGLGNLADLFQRFKSALSLIKGAGVEADVDDVDLSKVEAILGLSSGPNIPVIANVRGTAAIRIALELDRVSARVQRWDVDATVLLRVQRVLKGDEHHMIGDPFGGLADQLPADRRREFVDHFATDEARRIGIGELEISAPGIVGMPIAIYR